MGAQGAAGGGAELPGVGVSSAGGGQRLQGQRAVRGRRQQRQRRLVRSHGEAQHPYGAIQTREAALPAERQRLRNGGNAAGSGGRGAAAAAGSGRVGSAHLLRAQEQHGRALRRLRGREPRPARRHHAGLREGGGELPPRGLGAALPGSAAVRSPAGTAAPRRHGGLARAALARSARPAPPRALKRRRPPRPACPRHAAPGAAVRPALRRRPQRPRRVPPGRALPDPRAAARPAGGARLLRVSERGAVGVPPFPAAARAVCARRAAAFKSHGYHLAQTMRFAVEEINNSSALLPNVTLRCEIHDTCTEAANLHATLRALGREGRHRIELPSALQRYEPRAVAVIGPDSTQLALTAAAILGVFLVPEVGPPPRRQYAL